MDLTTFYTFPPLIILDSFYSFSWWIFKDVLIPSYYRVLCHCILLQAKGFFLIFYFMCIIWVFACMFVHHVLAVPKKVGKGCWIAQKQSYRWLWTTVWMLEVKPGPLEEHHWTIFPAAKSFYCICYLRKQHEIIFFFQMVSHYIDHIDLEIIKILPPMPPWHWD